MSYELDEGLPGVAGTHLASGNTLAGVVSSTVVPASPEPGALDVVSHMISRVMKAHTPTVYHPTSTAIDYWSHGAEGVIQANATYHGTDLTGGSEVAARDRFQ